MTLSTLTPLPTPQRARLFVRPKWGGDDGTAVLLRVALPLSFAAMSAAMNLFMDRWFLAHYDPLHHLPAAMSGGTTWWTVMQVLFGVVVYVSTFVAQYHGANRPDRIGATLWQGLYIGAVGGVFMLATMPFALPLFELLGKEDPIPELEAAHYRILCYGAPFIYFNGAFSGFYSGRGKVAFMALVNGWIAFYNILLNSWLIYDPPKWMGVDPGVEGAAAASALATVSGTLIFVVITFGPRINREFKILASWRPDFKLMHRLVRYGTPQAFQFLIDVGGFTAFMHAVGHLDPEALSASAIAFSMNLLVFIPVLGMSQGIGILVGQFVGQGRPQAGERITCTGMILAVSAMLVASSCYLLFPEFFVDIFLGHGPTEGVDVAAVERMAAQFLLFVGIYAVGDAIGIVYAGAIKGAGDTRFVAITIAGLSGGVLVVPSILSVVLHWAPVSLWYAITVWVVCFATIMTLRYRTGRWKTMSVIEPELVIHDVVMHDAPPPGGVG